MEIYGLGILGVVIEKKSGKGRQWGRVETICLVCYYFLYFRIFTPHIPPMFYQKIVANASNYVGSCRMQFDDGKQLNG